MAKKSARRQKNKLTKSQLKRNRRLQHFGFSRDAAHRVRARIRISWKLFCGALLLCVITAHANMH